jgi:hypothetical protein
MNRSIAAALFAIAQISAANAKTSETDYSQRIIGEWQGARHIRAFYPDGTFNLDPYPGKPPLGRWTISGDRLTIIFTTTFGDDPNPEVDRIVKLTKNDLVIEVLSANRKDRGARYPYKRVRKPEV